MFQVLLGVRDEQGNMLFGPVQRVEMVQVFDREGGIMVELQPQSLKPSTHSSLAEPPPTVPVKEP